MTPVLSVVGCSVKDDTRLRVRFNSGDVRIVDMSPLFSLPAFAPLGNPAVFRNYSIDHGILTWMDGELDVAPEWLLDHGCTEAYPDAAYPPLFVAEGDGPASPAESASPAGTRGGSAARPAGR